MPRLNLVSGIGTDTFLCFFSCFPLFLELIKQILFLSGLPLIIGPTKTFYFFSRREKWRGTLCFFGGM